MEQDAGKHVRKHFRGGRGDVVDVEIALNVLRLEPNQIVPEGARRPHSAHGHQVEKMVPVRNHFSQRTHLVAVIRLRIIL